jgi:hypothetical protein
MNGVSTFQSTLTTQWNKVSPSVQIQWQQTADEWNRKGAPPEVVEKYAYTMIIKVNELIQSQTTKRSS